MFGICDYWIVLLFSYLEIIVVNSALNNKFNLRTCFFPVVVYAVFWNIGIYIYRSIRIK